MRKNVNWKVYNDRKKCKRDSGSHDSCLIATCFLTYFNSQVALIFDKCIYEGSEIIPDVYIFCLKTFTGARLFGF